MSEEQKERESGVTIGELRAFLQRIPAEFDDFGMVNGEVAHIDAEVYARIDKPIVYLSIDEANKEFVLLHQTESEVNDVMKSVEDGQATKTEENGTT